MTVYFGFYNSSSGDREYDAIDFSKLFDGLINDGIFASQGDKFIVVEDTPASMDVVVGSGRAWFNHTWTLNDADLDVTVPTAHATLNRIDIVYLEVDESTRTNSIDIVSGTPATTPVAPTLTQTSTVHQYALAHIYVGAAVTSIGQEDITNKVGLSATPFVTGIIDQIDVDDLMLEWQAEWDTWFDDIKDQLSTEAETNLQAQIWDLAGVASGAPPYATDMVELYSHDHSVAPGDQIPTAGIEDLAITLSKMALNSVDDTKIGNRVAKVGQRRGGHATDWNTAGSTAYTINGVKIQLGAVSITVSAYSDYIDQIVYFPETYTYKPLVFVVCGTTSDPFHLPSIVMPRNHYPDNVTIRLHNFEARSYTVYANVYWLAIGPV